MRTEFKDYYERKEYEQAYENASTYYAIFWIYAKGCGYNIYKGDFKKAWKEYCEQDCPMVKEMLSYVNYKKIRQDAVNDYFKTKMASEKKLNENNK